MSVDLMNTDRDDQYFGKTTHFDTGKKIYIKCTCIRKYNNIYLFTSIHDFTVAK